MGPRPARLAHRMLGDDRARISARRSTSTAAGSTSSSRTTRMRSRRAAAPTAARRSRATGCTTASSTWARRRCRRASAMSSRRRTCWRRGTRARRCGWRLLSAHYRQPLPWTEEAGRAGEGQPRPALSAGGRCRTRRARPWRGRRALATISTRLSHWSRLTALDDPGARRSGSAQGCWALLQSTDGDEWFQGDGDAGADRARIAERRRPRRPATSPPPTAFATN